MNFHRPVNAQANNVDYQLRVFIINNFFVVERQRKIQHLNHALIALT